MLMKSVLKLILWPFVFWKKSSRVFMRVIVQAVDMGAPASHLLSEWQYFRSWRASLRPGASPVESCLPWLTFRATTYLSAHTNPGYKVFEYGGGGSTLFFLSRGAYVTTTEHDQGWFELLGKKIGASRFWAGALVLPVLRNPPSACDPSDPFSFGTSDEQLKDFEFTKYVQSIRAHPDAEFDIVCVDGRSRPACIALSRAKVKRGGLLILDNAERDTYARAAKLCTDGFEVVLDAPGSVPSCRWPSQTIIWKKL